MLVADEQNEIEINNILQRSKILQRFVDFVYSLNIRITTFVSGHDLFEVGNKIVAFVDMYVEVIQSAVEGDCIRGIDNRRT